MAERIKGVAPRLVKAQAGCIARLGVLSNLPISALVAQYGLGVSKPWQEYQQAAASFFRSLGLDATCDETLVGARGRHAVDVAVRFRQVGLSQLWVVECKLWRRSVPKDRVLVLQGVVDDLGADRGILLSESGFQAGAIRAARNSSITLTSLSDLKDNAAEESRQIGLHAGIERAARLHERILSLTETERVRPHTAVSRAALGVDMSVLIKAMSYASLVGDGLTKALIGGRPFSVDIATDSIVWEATAEAALSRAEVILAKVEGLITEQESRTTSG